MRFKYIRINNFVSKLAGVFASFVLCFFCSLPVGVAQGGHVFDWVQAVGGADWDVAYDVELDATGNIFVIGVVGSVVDLDPGPGVTNGRGMFISKYNSSGLHQWSKSWDGDQHVEAIQALAIDTSNNIYITGNFRGTVDFDTGPGTANRTAFSVHDMFFAKLDLNGNLLWVHTFGSWQYDSGLDLAVDSAGSVYVVGSSNDILDLDPGPGTDIKGTSGGGFAFLSKYDSAGSYLWSLVDIGGLRSLCIDQSDNLYAAHTFGGTFDFDPGPGTDLRTASGLWDVALSKYDSTGAHLWTRTFGGPDEDNLQGIVCKNPGAIFLTGYWNSGSVDFDPGPGLDVKAPLSIGTMYIAKYNPAGDYQWVKIVGGGAGVYPWSVDQDSNGNIVVAGDMNFGPSGIDFDPSTGVANKFGPGDKEIFLAKYNSQGDYQCARVIGGTGPDECFGAATDINDNTYIAGRFRSTVDFDPGLNTVNKTAVDLDDLYLARFHPDALAPTAPVITSPSDGVLTNLHTPTLVGTAEPNSTISVYRSGTLMMSFSADSAGDWSYTTGFLLDGTHALTVTATDDSCNTSPSAALSLRIDTSTMAPVITSPVTGTNTNDNTPTISGTSEADSTVTVFRSGTNVGTALANGSGAWSFTPGTSWPDGTYNLTATSVDLAGNASGVSNTVILTIDATNAAPVILSPFSGTTTNDNTPTISGTAERNSTVTIFRSGTNVGTALADGSGVWSYTPGTSWSDGTYNLTATSVDLAGNASGVSNTVVLTIDTHIPGPPIIFTPISGTVTDDTTPTFTGTAEANSTVTIYRSGSVAGSTVTNGAGNWVFTPTLPWLAGTYNVSAISTIASGSSSLESNIVSLTIELSLAVQSYNLSGTVTYEGSPLSGITIAGGLLGSATTNSSGFYSFNSIPSGTSYSIVPNNIYYVISPVVASGTLIAHTTHNFTATPRSYVISGHVTNGTEPIVGALISGSGIGSQWTNASGYYAFPALSHGSVYSIAVKRGDYSFGVSTASGVLVADVVHDFVGKRDLHDYGGCLVRAGGDRPAIVQTRVTMEKLSTVTDDSGCFNFPGAPKGEHIIAVEGYTSFSSNNLASGGSTLIEVTPVSKEPILLYAPWNGYLGNVVIVEIFNTGSEPLEVVLSLFKMSGSQKGVEAGRIKYSISPREERDVIVNDIVGFEADHYGVLKASLSGTHYNGQVSYYKLAPGGGFSRDGTPHEDFDYVFPNPLSSPITGVTYAMFNTHQPSFHPAESRFLVANWLTIINGQEGPARYFLIRKYDELGKRIPIPDNAGTVRESCSVLDNEVRCKVPALGRIDLDGGHVYPGMGHSGLIEVIPEDSETVYVANLVRYGIASSPEVYSDRYSFAAYLQTRPGGSREMILPLSTINSALNWIELGNGGEEPTTALVRYFDNDGKVLDEETYTIKPRSHTHISANAVLGDNNTGTARIISESKNAKLLSTNLLYYRNSEGRVQAVYATQSEEPAGATSYGTFNRFLNMENWLTIKNLLAEARDIKLVLHASGVQRDYTISLLGHGGVNLALHDEEFGLAANTLGMLEIRDTVGSSNFAHLLRSKPLSDGGKDFMLATKVR